MNIYKAFIALALLLSASPTQSQSVPTQAWKITFGSFGLDLSKHDTLTPALFNKFIARVVPGSPGMTCFTNGTLMRIEMFDELKIIDRTKGVCYLIDTALKESRTKKDMGAENIQPQLFDDTVTIAGYVCKEAVFKTATLIPEDELIVWYTPLLPPLYDDQSAFLQRLHGCVLASGVYNKVRKTFMGGKATAVRAVIVDRRIFTP